MNRRIFLCAITMCAMSMSAIAVLPAHNPVSVANLSNQLFLPVFGNGQALVTSTVYTLAPTAGGYLYTYEISSPTAQFTWFSVALSSGTPILTSGYESLGILPTNWLPTGVPVTSMEAFFASGLTSGSNSALLWFTTPNGPVTGEGALARLSVKGGTYAIGDVLVPVPEPITMTLLGLGWLAVRSYRRKG